MSTVFYMEVKHARPADCVGNKLILRHEFTPSQYKHAKLITKTGNKCVGLIEVKDRSYIIPPSCIEERNFRMKDLERFTYIEKAGGVWDIPRLLNEMKRIERVENGKL